MKQNRCTARSWAPSLRSPPTGEAAHLSGGHRTWVRYPPLGEWLRWTGSDLDRAGRALLTLVVGDGFVVDHHAAGGVHDVLVEVHQDGVAGHFDHGLGPDEVAGRGHDHEVLGLVDEVVVERLVEDEADLADGVVHRHRGEPGAGAHAAGG